MLNSLAMAHPLSTTMNPLHFPDILQVMDYSLSHKILLLRTTEIIGSVPQNTDLLFSSTFYVEVPTILHEATLCVGTADDYAYVSSRCEEEIRSFIRSNEIFVLAAFNQKYYIGAGHLKVFHNTYEGGETSIGLKR